MVDYACAHVHHLHWHGIYIELSLSLSILLAMFVMHVRCILLESLTAQQYNCHAELLACVMCVSSLCHVCHTCIRILFI